MKYLWILYAVAICYLPTKAQENSLSSIRVGDLLVIGCPMTPRYKYIQFPKPNFIVKRGGVANYSRVKGLRVVVIRLKKKRNGTTKVRIKRSDGKRFFGTHAVVSANIEQAIEYGELELW